jgi:hypothetical protein
LFYFLYLYIFNAPKHMHVVVVALSVLYVPTAVSQDAQDLPNRQLPVVPPLSKAHRVWARQIYSPVEENQSIGYGPECAAILVTGTGKPAGDCWLGLGDGRRDGLHPAPEHGGVSGCGGGKGAGNGG